MNPTQAIIRCADLTRLFPDIRTKRVAFEVQGSDITIGATDGHVAARYALKNSPADLAFSDGAFTAEGADFPKWGSYAWQILHVREDFQLACQASTAKGARTATTKKKDRLVAISAGRGEIFTVWDMITNHRAPAGDATEIGEIRDALEILDSGAEIRFWVNDEDQLELSSGPWSYATTLPGPPRAPGQWRMGFSVEILDRALGLLEGLDACGLTWDFPIDPLDPLIIRSHCKWAEVLAMPLRV